MEADLWISWEYMSVDKEWIYIVRNQEAYDDKCVGISHIGDLGVFDFSLL